MAAAAFSLLAGRPISERSFREIDLSLVAPLRHASGSMLVASALSLFGWDADELFGRLGFTNVLGWADPQRALPVGLTTTGKSLLHPALGELWLLARAIGGEWAKPTSTAARLPRDGLDSDCRRAP